jgi:hypothetical protein
MNPWLQGAWSDVHTMLIGYIRDTLGEELPDDLSARAEENVTLCSPVEEVEPRWVEICSAKGKLITVIEVSSSWNKAPRGRRDFDLKLRGLVQGGVNVMEIDLIRGGCSAHDDRASWPQEPCQVIVTRAAEPGRREIYPCPLREPLPAVAVPLRVNEPDAALDLQPLIDRCYRLGRYWMLPYHEPPPGELTEADLDWARERVREAGLGS